MTSDELKPEYERVHAVLDYYDGPRKDRLSLNTYTGSELNRFTITITKFDGTLAKISNE